MKEKSRILSKLMGLAVIACVTAMLFGMTTFAANKYIKMSPGVPYTNLEKDAGITHYYQINVKSSGTIQFNGIAKYSTSYGSSYFTGLTVKFCNSKGKVLDTKTVNSNYDNDVMYAVNKGTYMLKIQTSNEFAVAYKFNAYKEKSGGSLKKAVSLKKKKVKYGVLGIGEPSRKTDCYKIVLKKPAKIYLDVETRANSTINIKIKPSKTTKVTGSKTYYFYNDRKSIKLQTTSGGKLPKGTYFISINRLNKSSKVNGIYALKWRK